MSPIRAVLVVSSLVVTAGCLSPADGPGSAGLPPLAGIDIPAVDIGHDHKDPALHPGREAGLRAVTAIEYVTGDLPVPGVLEAGMAGRLAVAGDRLFIATDHDTRSGFAVVDVSDPRAPRLLGNYKSDYGTSEGEALAATADAAFAFVAIETTFTNPPVPPAIEIVDASDPAAPTLALRYPMAELPHVFGFFEADGREYLIVNHWQLTVLGSIATGQPGASAAADGFTIFEFSRSPVSLTPVARHVFDPRGIEEGFFFAHDPTVIQHPVTGERLLYQGAFGGGGRIYDIEDPRNPVEIGYTLEKGASPILRWHSFLPAPVVVDGVLATAATPRTETGDGPASAFLTFYDTADPTAPTLLGQWRHPDDDLIPGDDPHLNLHIPFFSRGAKLLGVTHNHAGLFLFDTSTREALADPRPVAHWIPPPRPDLPERAREVGVVATAVMLGDVILATDTVAGTLYVLETSQGARSK
ncbi:MAG: LVIVD repeat-containing protein [Methanobacteriota archaeon]